MTLLRRVVPLQIVLLATSAGCGGETLDKEEYAQRGDEVCRRASEASEKLDSSSPRALARSMDELVRASQRQARELGELSPPEGLEDQADRLAEAFERRSELLRRVRDATRRGGVEGFQRALNANRTEGMRANREVARLSRELGLSECGQVPDAAG